MATWNANNSMFTEVGVEILNKIKLGGSPITLSRIVAGSGRVTESQLYNLTTVKGTQREMTLISANTIGNVSELSFFIDNEGYEESYDLHQIGVYVTHPDYSGEQLYFIVQCDKDDYDTIPPVSLTPVKLMYSLVLEHGNSESIVFNINPVGAVSLEMFEAFKAQNLEQHNLLSGRISAVTQNFNAFKSGVKERKLLTADTNGNLISSGKATATGKNIVVTDACDHRALSLSIQGSTRQIGTPTPTTPATLVGCPISYISSYRGKNPISLTAPIVKGKNSVFNEISQSVDSISGSTSSGINYLGIIIPTTVGKTYTLRFDKISYCSNSFKELDHPISEIDPTDIGIAKTSPYTFTATKPFFLLTAYNNTVPSFVSLSSVQLEEGSSTSAYEKFNGNLYKFPATYELDGIDEYSDSVEWDGSKWWLVKRIGTLILDGATVGYKVSTSTELWNKSNNYSRFIIQGLQCHSTKPLLCTHGNCSADDVTAQFGAIPTRPMGTDDKLKYVGIHTLNSLFSIESTDNSSARATKVNNWLKEQLANGTPVTIKYALTNPIVTEISYTEVLNMYPNLFKLTNSACGISDMVLGYALDTTDDTTMYILKSLARKSEVQTANTFAVATLEEDEE